MQSRFGFQQFSRLGVAGASGLALAVGSLLIAAPPASAATCAITFDGSAAMDTVAELQAAMASAATGACVTSADTVVVTFTADLTWTSAQELEWPSAYAADLTLQGSATLDGDGLSVLLDARGGDTVTIDGLTLRDAVAGSGDYGTAVQASGPNLSIRNASFINNIGGEYGGAIGFVGGGLFISVVDSYFEGNSSDYGGALYIESDIEISNTTFRSNIGLSEGGAIYQNNGAGSLDIRSSTFTGNQALKGGAVYADDFVDIVGSTFTANMATSEGGALRLGDNDANLLNSTLASNTAANGGGLYLEWEIPLALDFVTIASNSASGFGANIFVLDGDVRPDVRGSVIGNALGADNCSGVSLSWRVVESVIDSAEDTSCGPGFTSASWSEIALGALADNGGATQTMMPAPTSVLVSFVTDPTATALTTEDQRGYSRSGAYTAGAVQWGTSAPEPDLSQLPPSWYQAYQRASADELCVPGWDPSWAEWANDDAGGWTCERTIRWDVRKDGWVEVSGFRMSANKV